jgi:hypothetical protein
MDKHLAPSWDYFLLSHPNGTLARSPGLAKVRGASRPRNWDIQKGYGLDGAGVVYTSSGLAEFSIDIFLWLNSHWEIWPEFAKLLDAPATQKERALGIVHPLLAMPPLGIMQSVVKDITQFEYNDSTQLWACEIKFLQFKVPTKAPLTKAKSGIPGGSVAIPTAKDEAEAKILQMVGQVHTLTEP